MFPTKQCNNMLYLCTVNKVYIYMCICICFVSNKVVVKVQ